MKLSDMTEMQKSVMSELESELGFSLEEDCEASKFFIMPWKWVVRCDDFDFYNKVADKLGGEVAETRYSQCSFQYDLPNYGPYNFWYNI